MRVGYIVKDGSGRHYRVESMRYAPMCGIWMGLARPRGHWFLFLSDFLRGGGQVVRKAGEP